MKKNNIILLFLVAAVSCFSQDQLKIIDNNIKTKLKKFPTVGVVIEIYKNSKYFINFTFDNLYNVTWSENYQNK